jgi:hypothetical protein
MGAAATALALVVIGIAAAFPGETTVASVNSAGVRVLGGSGELPNISADGLEHISTDPSARLRDIAADVGITERTAAHIVKDLEAAGYLSKTRNGRRNRYEVHGELPLRHPRHRHRKVGDLIRFLETDEKLA